ncbi:MAG TPA: DUF3422 domain-containing protein [Candidatus Accumulibacter phosphatis]|nr:MAG: hypothetical protein AW07_00398 [Candidatus Accumulibacter sp. SK-11]HRL74159.1 DUF3422 domain-containing protein [Candidatus Accumulibacter phosphatis]HRQ94750.1 DUF3422 domain-containing protein [Candidatus Accumulibacter phosphatis]
MTTHPEQPPAGLAQHPLRQLLNDSFHARPTPALRAPALVSHLVFTHEPASLAGESERLEQAAGDAGMSRLSGSDNAALFAGAGLLLRWERHTEFSSYTVFSSPAGADPIAPTTSAIDLLPRECLQAVPGQLIVATHVELRTIAEVAPQSITAELSPTGRQMIAAQVADQAAWVFTDFMLDQGATRFLVIDASLTPRQAGRTVQRLLEIETYRLLALLALPVATDVGGWMRQAEEELATMVDHIGEANSPADESHVLGELTRLAAKVEHSLARTNFRFAAARAYHELVMQRIIELRETRVSGCPTFHEIMQRRLLPAMQTCNAMASRQDELSDRLARTSQLLRTRVDVELERQNQQLLAQMNRRAHLQLRLQETVEGLSVVAITYYASQLVHYLAKGANQLLPQFSPELATAVSIPLIAAFAVLGIGRLRQRLQERESAAH